MTQRPYEKLIVWQEAYKLHLWIYSLTEKFPKKEQYSLVKQMRTAAYSVPMNIAEGNAKRTPKHKCQFFEIGLGSLEELHCQTRMACDLHYITEEEFHKTDEHINRVSYLLTRLRAAFKKHP